jgi:hypothetical protein
MRGFGEARRVTAYAIATAIAIATAGAGVAGCVVNEPESPPRGVVVSGPPPAPVREERPAPPNPQAVWVPGYWHWTGMQYAWIPGHYDAAPAGAVWAAPQYTSKDGKFFYESGRWSAPPNRNAIR